MMAGGLLALVKRTREAKRAVVPATEPSREPQPTSAVTIPVTASARLSTEA
jgi:hypothetical protein